LTTLLLAKAQTGSTKTKPAARKIDNFIPPERAGQRSYRAMKAHVQEHFYASCVRGWLRPTSPAIIRSGMRYRVVALLMFSSFSVAAENVAPNPTSVAAIRRW
jgi:hypothetical protein